MRPFLHPNVADIELAGVLHALGDPARLEIVRALAAGGELSCGAAVGCGLPKSTVSHHFAILRAAGLIRSRRQGIHLMSMLRRSDLDARFPGLIDSVLASARRPSKVLAPKALVPKTLAPQALPPKAPAPRARAGSR